MVTAVDPIALEIIDSKFTGIVEEMRVIMFHSGYSPILRESEDGSVGVIDARLRTVATSKKLPLHFASFSPIADHLFNFYKPDELEEGDVILYNHPYLGHPTHPGDIATLVPVFVDGSIVAYTGSLAQKADLGGPRDNRPDQDMWEGGILIPPIKFYRRGTVIPEIERMVAYGCRMPKEMLGDLRAQVAACYTGARRIQELCARFGTAAVEGAAHELIDRIANRLREELRSLPDGVGEAEAFMDIAVNRRVRVHLKVTKHADEILFDFSESDKELPGAYNANPTVIKNCCYFGLMAMTDPNLPFNHGFVEVAQTRLKEGTIVRPSWGISTNGYVLLTYLTADVVVRALGELWPDRAVGASGGGGGGGARGRSIRVQELLDSALGATSTSDGVSLIHGLMGVGQFRPGSIEMHETTNPVRITRFDVRTDSGGPGKFRGGLGAIREYQVLEEAVGRATSGVGGGGRRKSPPWGVFGGQPGRIGSAWVNGVEDAFQGVNFQVLLKPGDMMRLATNGGGGYGNPLERDPEAVLGDVLEGYVSIKGARDDYGVVISEEKLKLNLAATGVLRRQKRKQP